MPEIQHIFLDDGGVINDNSRRQPQWRQLVGEFFPPRLGGTTEQWEEANTTVVGLVWDRFSARAAAWKPSDGRYEREQDIYRLDWLRSMCSRVGVAPPETDEACLALANEALHSIMLRVRADFPGAVDTVRWLAERYAVRTASGGTSSELAMYYEPLGIVDCFQRLYGADLIQQPKTGRRYYDCIFADAGVDPATCLVLDDGTSSIAWAREAGARAVLVSARIEPVTGIPVITALRDLPALLASGI